MITISRPWLLAFALTALSACSGSRDPVQLSFDSAWVRSMPPGSMMTAGFGELTNTGSSDWLLKSISSPAFADVSLHQTVTEDGMSRMRGVDDLGLGAGETLILEPGGYHLMLMRPTGDMPDNVTVTFELETGQQFSFELPVESR